MLFLLIMKETGNNFPMENQNLSFLLTADTGTLHRRDLTGILNYVTVQGIVTDAFDQVIIKIKSSIPHTSDTVLNRSAAVFLNELNSVVFFHQNLHQCCIYMWSKPRL